MAPQKTMMCIPCRDSGADCDYEVRDSDEAEVLASVQGHASRKHGMDVTLDQLRPLMRDVRQTSY